jgi:peroxiredoxin family protein
MKKAKDLLEENWKIFMTNWALNSELNNEKYKNSQIKNSKNNFWSLDYNIKIGKFDRFYHCFNLKELEFLAKNSWLKIIENRLFENNRNFITILEK